jgi:hypothetical protein
MMHDVAGSYTLPSTVAGLLLLPAALSALAIREKKYCGKEQSRPLSTSTVDTSAAPV